MNHLHEDKTLMKTLTAYRQRSRDDAAHGRIGADAAAERRKANALANIIAGLLLAGLTVLGFLCLVVPQ